MAFEVHFGLRLDLRRVRQKLNYCIKNILYTFVFKSRSAVRREEIQGDCALADAALEVLDRRLIAFEVLFQQVVVLFHGRFDEFLAPFLDEIVHVFGHVRDLVILRIVAPAPDPCLARQQVDDAPEIVLDADRQHHDQRFRRQYILDLLHNAIVVCADAVEFVDENNSCHFGFVGITPVCLRLRLDTAGSAEHAHTAVENLQRTIDLDREVHVSGRVDDVQGVIFPVAAGRSRLDRDATLLFLLHEVRRGFTVVDFTRTVDLARELQDALGRRGLARVHVGKDADVAVSAQVFHVSVPAASTWRRSKILSQGFVIASRPGWVGLSGADNSSAAAPKPAIFRQINAAEVPTSGQCSEGSSGTPTRR